MPTVRREDLYEQVWSRPMLTLAVDYGISSVALAKACRKSLIPVPPRGYWNKIQHGKPVMRKPPLPAGDGLSAVIEITRSSPKRPVISDPVMARHAKELEASAGRIEVAEALRSPHPAIVVLRDVAAGPRPKQSYSTAVASWIDVEKGTKGRALRILDALFKALEAQGYAVDAGGAMIEGQRIPISVSERTDKVLHVATVKEKAEKAKYSWTRIPTWDQVPNGRLSIAADVYLWPAQDVRKRWSEGRGRPLEDSLADIVLGLIAVGVTMRLRDEERQAEEERRQEEALRRAEQARQIRIAKARDQDILASAKAFRRAGEVRALIRAVEAQAGTAGGQDAEVLAWMERANKLAECLDPTSKGQAEMMRAHRSAAEAAADQNPQTRMGVHAHSQLEQCRSGFYAWHLVRRRARTSEPVDFMGAARTRDPAARSAPIWDHGMSMAQSAISSGRPRASKRTVM